MATNTDAIQQIIEPFSIAAGTNVLIKEMLLPSEGLADIQILGFSAAGVGLMSFFFEIQVLSPNSVWSQVFLSNGVTINTAEAIAQISLSDMQILTSRGLNGKDSGENRLYGTQETSGNALFIPNVVAPVANVFLPVFRLQTGMRLRFTASSSGPNPSVYGNVVRYV